MIPSTNHCSIFSLVEAGASVGQCLLYKDVMIWSLQYDSESGGKFLRVCVHLFVLHCSFLSTRYILPCSFALHMHDFLSNAALVTMVFLCMIFTLVWCLSFKFRFWDFWGLVAVLVTSAAYMEVSVISRLFGAVSGYKGYSPDLPYSM